MKTTAMQYGVGARIRAEVASWPGISEATHRFGGTEFRLGKREIGHLHGDVLADLPFPVAIREQLVREGKARTHHYLPETGWVSLPLRDEDSVEAASALFRMAYDRALAQRGLPANLHDPASD